MIDFFLHKLDLKGSLHTYSLRKVPKYLLTYNIQRKNTNCSQILQIQQKIGKFILKCSSTKTT